MKLSSPFVPRLSLPGHQSIGSIQTTLGKNFPWPLPSMQPMAATWEELKVYPLDIFVIEYTTGKPTQLFTSTLFNLTASLEYRSAVAMHDSQHQVSWHKGGWLSC